MKNVGVFQVNDRYLKRGFSAEEQLGEWVEVRQKLLLCFYAHWFYENMWFAKTGSGQTEPWKFNRNGIHFYRRTTL